MADLTGKPLVFLSECLFIRHLLDYTCELPTAHLIPCLFQADSASLPKKSRLPVLLKSYRSLGNVPLSSCVQKSDSNLRPHSMAPYEGLKACEVQPEQFEPQTNGELNESVIESLQEDPQERTSVRGK